MWMVFHHENCPDRERQGPCHRVECRPYVLAETRALFGDATILIPDAASNKNVWLDKLRKLMPFLYPGPMA